MNSELIPLQNDFEPIIQLVLDSVSSKNSKVAYKKSLQNFMNWYLMQGKSGLTRVAVQAYKASLEKAGLSASVINLRLSAVKKLASEAAENGLIDSTAASGIERIKGMSQKGTRIGKWLSKAEVETLLTNIDRSTLLGLRDYAVIALMIGSGLRRSEIAGLTFDHIQMREARWVIVDLVGKGNRIRSVPIPAWAKSAIDCWAKAGNLSTGRVFRSINKGGGISETGITAQGIYNIVVNRSAVTGGKIAAHDIRRTFAKLAYKGGGKLEQIQMTLGHASIQTTERYLGSQQDLQNPPCDLLGLNL